MSDILELVLEAALDTSEEGVSRLKKDAEELNKKLAGQTLTFGVELDDKTIKELKKQVEEVGKAVNTIAETANFSKLQEELNKMTLQAGDFETGVKNIKDQTDLLSESVKFDFMKDSIYNVKEVQKDLVTTQKTLIGINSLGEKISDELTETVNVANAQKKVYNDLSKVLTNINTLETARLQAGDGTRNALDKEIKAQKAVAKEIQDSLDAYGIRNKELDREVEATKQLRDIQMAIRKEKSQGNQSSRAYSELTKAIKDEGKILRDMVGTEGEVNELYLARLGTVQRIRMELEKQISKDGLTNPEKELELKKEIDKITADIAIKEGKKARQEELRVAKLNERLMSLQELSGDTGNIAVRGNQDEIEKMVLSMADLRREASDGQLKMLSYQQVVDSTGNTQARMTVQARRQNGMMKEYKLVVDEATQSIYKLGERTKETSNRSLEFSQRMLEAIKRTIQWGLSTKVIQVASDQIRQAIEQVKEMDKELTQTTIVTGKTKEEIQQLGDSYYELGYRMSKTAKEVSALNTSLIRQGLATDEATRRMQTTLKFSASAGVDANESLKIITAGVNAMGSDAERFADVMLKAGNVSASSAEEVGTALTRVASSAETANLSLEDTAALTATLIEVTQESPSSLGNSLKTLVSRFNKIDTETGAFNTSLNQTQQAFESVGISFTDTKNQIRPMYSLLVDLNGVWESLDKNTKNYIATAAAGANQRNRFLAIMNNFNRVQEVHNELMASEGTLNQSYGVYIDSIEAKYNRLEVTLERIRADILSSDTLGFVLETADAILGLATATDTFGLSIAKLGAVFLAGELGAKGLSKYLSPEMRDAFQVVDAEGVLFTQNLGKMIKSLKNNGVELTFNKLLVKMYGEEALATGAKVGISTAAIAANTVALAAFQTVVTMGIGALISFGVGALGKFLSNLHKSKSALKDLADEVDKNIAKGKNNIATLETMGERFEELQEKMHSVTGELSMTNEEQVEYYKLANKINEIAPETVQRFNEKGDAVIKYGTNLKELIETEKDLIDLERYRVISEEKKYNKQFDKTRKSKEKALDEIEKQIKLEEEKLNSYEGSRAGASNAETSERFLRLIDETRAKIQELRTQQKMHQVELQDAQKDHDALTEAYMAEIDGIEGVSKSLRNLIKERANEKLMSEGSGADADYIRGMARAIGDYKDAVEGLPLDKTIAQTKSLLDAFKELGVPVQEAELMVYQLAVGLEEVDVASLSTADSMGVLLERVQGYSDKLDKLSSTYQKLAQGQKLTASETMELSNEYEKLSEIVLETGELTIDNLKDLEDVMEDITDARLKDLRNTQRQHLEDMKRTEALIERLSTIMSYMEKMGIISKGVSSLVSKEYEKHKAALKGMKAEYEKIEKQIQTIERVQGQAFENAQMNNYQAGLKSATSKVKDLEKIMKSLNDEGQITQEVALQIIEQYPDLMYYLDNEAVLREKINEKIRENAKAQDKYYKEILMMTDSFTVAFYNKNSSLVDDVANIYNIDLKNFESVTQAKIALMNAFVDSFSDVGMEMAENYGGGTKGQLKMMKDLKALKETGDTTGAKELWGAFSPEQQAMSIEEINKTIELLEKREAAAEEFDTTKSLSKMPSLSSGGKKTSSSRGGSIQLIDEIELLTDRYLKFEKAINEVSRSIEYTESLMELTTGKDRIKQMEKINALTREQQRLINLRANEERKELKELEKALKDSLDLDDGTFGIDSFAKYSKDIENNINSIISTLNKTKNEGARKSLTQSKEKMEKDYNDIKTQFEKYVALRDSIPDLSKEWWILEYEILNKTLEAVDFRYEQYNEQVSHLTDQLGLLIKTRKSSVDELANELGIMKQITDIQTDSLKDIEEQSEQANLNVARLEKQLEGITKKNSVEYSNAVKRLAMARAEQDKYFEHYKIQLNSLAEQQRSLLSKYMEIVNQAKENTLEALEEIRVKFEGFDLEGFENSLGNILADLDKLDKVFVQGALPNLDTSNARKDLKMWKNSIIDTVGSLEDLKAEIEKVSMVEVSTREGALRKQEKINELLEKQIEKENELKILERDLRNEIAEIELSNKKMENALQNQIDLKQDELNNLKEQEKKEDKIRALKEKQLELMRAMDDTRYSYITGAGEEVFSYDQEKVLALQKDLANMRRSDERENRTKGIQEEIKAMQEELNRTKEINKQELEVLKLAANGIGELAGVLGKDITNSTDILSESFEKMGDLYALELRANMEEFTYNYQSYWDNKLRRIALDPSVDNRNINKDKLGGDKNERFDTRGNTLSNDPTGRGKWSGYTEGRIKNTADYSIKEGDTLESIAERFGTTLEGIALFNKNISNLGSLMAGDTISVPIGQNKIEKAGLTYEDLLLSSSRRDEIQKNLNMEFDKVSPLYGRANLDLQEKSTKNSPVFNLYNPEFNEVDDVRDFANEMFGVARGNIPKFD